MKSRSIGIGAGFGIVHAVLVGYLFHPINGGGENFLIIAMVDLPLYVLGEILFPRLLSSSVEFVVVYFIAVGTLMYALAGYYGSRLVCRITGRDRGP